MRMNKKNGDDMLQKNAKSQNLNVLQNLFS